MFMRFCGGGPGHVGTRSYNKKLAEDCHLLPQRACHQNSRITVSNATPTGGVGNSGEDIGEGADGAEEEGGEDEEDEEDNEDEEDEEDNKVGEGKEMGAGVGGAEDDGEGEGEDNAILGQLGYGAL
jgi:hypothetical protein